MTTLALLDVLKQRGLYAQSTGDSEIAALFSRQPLVAYTGFDPTAQSLHVGHLTPLMVLRHLANAGHKPVVIIGGGTAMVGDPTGKSETRPMLAAQTIAENGQRIAEQTIRIASSPSNPVRCVNNADHLLNLEYIAFLRDIGRHFSVNRMLSAESAKSRLEAGLSFIEFNYQLLQAYDFLVLSRQHSCQLQIGGDDQWGNILAGVDLCRRADGVRVEGLTVPLLTTASGAKMGKTASGAVWLDRNKTSANDFYQFWVNTSDDDVLRFLLIYTLLPPEQLAQVDVTSAAGAKRAKHLLAFEVCSLVHGHAYASQAMAAAQTAFGEIKIPDDWVVASTMPRSATFDLSSVPTLALSVQELERGIPVAMLLVRLGWCKSNNEARRALGQKGVRLDDTVFDDVQASIAVADLKNNTGLLRMGKRRVHRLVVG